MNKICKLVDEVLRNRRMTAISFAENNLKLARTNAKFCELEKREAELCFQIACLNADENFDEAKKKTNQLKSVESEKIDVLKNMGLSEKSIVPAYTCSICNDTGKGSCQCKTKIKSEILLKNSGITNLESFKQAQRFGTNFDKALDVVEKWAKSFPNVSKKNIFLSGETGVGKTFLTRCVVNELIQNGVYVYFTTAFALNELFISYCKARDDEKTSFLQPVLESDVLVIDDLGTEPLLNNITLNYLYLVLNERGVANKATIITSNLDPEGIIDRYGERIFSRVFDKRNGLAIEIHGQDLRLKKN